MSDKDFLAGIVSGMVTRARNMPNLETAEPVSMPPPQPRPLPPVASKGRPPSELHQQLAELNLLPPEPFPVLRTDKSKAVGVRRGARTAGQQGMSPKLKRHELVPPADPVPPRVRLGPGEVDVRARQIQRKNKMDTVKINLGRKANWKDPLGITVPIPGTPLPPTTMFKVNIRPNPAMPNVRTTSDFLQTPRVSLDRLSMTKAQVERHVTPRAQEHQQDNESLNEADFNWDDFGSAVKTPGLAKRQLAQRESGKQPLDIAVTMRQREDRERERRTQITAGLSR
jgi:hypothetical protein